MKAIKYKIENGLLKVYMEGYKRRYIVTPAMTFEQYRFHVLEKSHGYEYAIDHHDHDAAYDDLSTGMAEIEEINEMVAWMSKDWNKETADSLKN